MTYKQRRIEEINEEIKYQSINYVFLGKNKEYQNLLKRVCPENCDKNLSEREKPKWYINHIENCVEKSGGEFRSFISLINEVIGQEGRKFGEEKKKVIKEIERDVKAFYGLKLDELYDREAPDNQQSCSYDILDNCQDEESLKKGKAKWLERAEVVNEKKLKIKVELEKREEERTKEKKQKEEKKLEKAEWKIKTSQRVTDLEENLTKALQRIEKLELENKELKSQFIAQQEQSPK